jgi:hypothetical protein
VNRISTVAVAAVAGITLLALAKRLLDRQPLFLETDDSDSDSENKQTTECISTGPSSITHSPALSPKNSPTTFTSRALSQAGPDKLFFSILNSYGISRMITPEPSSERSSPDLGVPGTKSGRKKRSRGNRRRVGKKDNNN